jgi:hypothetical protein
MKLKRHAKIAQQIGEDYEFDISVIVTIDQERKIQISGATKTLDDRDLCVSMMAATRSAVMSLFGADKGTLH